jgi:hypothetical protein
MAPLERDGEGMEKRRTQEGPRATTDARRIHAKVEGARGEW